MLEIFSTDTSGVVFGAPLQAAFVSTISSNSFPLHFSLMLVTNSRCHASSQCGKVPAMIHKSLPVDVCLSTAPAYARVPIYLFLGFATQLGSPDIGAEPLAT